MSEMNVSHEVDFDKSGHGFKLHLSVKQIFWGGFLVGALSVIALGFMVMVWKGASLSQYFSGSLDRDKQAQVPSVKPTNNDNADAPTVPPPAVTKDDHVRGDVNAAVTLVEYSDFQCPYCDRFHSTMKQVADAYKGKIRWVYRHFPLSSIHPDAQKSAEAAECAAEQGKFWEMADIMFTNQTKGLSIAQLESYAKTAGVANASKFKTCLDSGKYASRVQSDQQGGEASGVNGTPGTFVVTKDGKAQLIPGALPFETVKQLLDSVIK
jgi:protein-disulfide isomerase